MESMLEEFVSFLALSALSELGGREDTLHCTVEKLEKRTLSCLLVLASPEIVSSVEIFSGLVLCTVTGDCQNSAVFAVYSFHSRLLVDEATLFLSHLI